MAKYQLTPEQTKSVGDFRARMDSHNLSPQDLAYCSDVTLARYLRAREW